MPSFFGMKKKGDACRDFDGTMHLVSRCFLLKASYVSISWGLREYTLVIFGVNMDRRLIVWS